MVGYGGSLVGYGGGGSVKELLFESIDSLSGGADGLLLRFSYTLVKSVLSFFSGIFHP